MTTYWKVGTTFRDYFDYAVTGLSDSDFTVEIAKDGVNQADAGTTITNVNSDKRYYFEGNAGTSFVAVSGTYDITVYRTAIPADRWQTTVVVNTLGLPTGTSGAASFTSTTADGRVTDGSSPLENASVFIFRSNGVLLTSDTTDSNGNWGPIQFDANGTYTLSVQLSGYSVGSGSVVVSGSSATGPGADIALSGSPSSGSMTATSLWAYARRMFNSRNGTAADAEIEGSVDDALAMLCSARDWPWLFTTGRINFKGAYSTGTVTVTEGSAVCTLAVGTWPSWVASGEVYIAGQWHPVTSRDSNSQITLANAWASPSTDGSGLAYIAAQYQYTMPTDCRTVVHVITQNGWLWGPIAVSRWMIDVAKLGTTGAGVGTNGVYMHAVEKNRMVVWPYPSTDLMVNVLYIKKPASLTSGPQTADWDDNQLEVLHRAIDYQVSLRGECVAGPTPELITWMASTPLVK